MNRLNPEYKWRLVVTGAKTLLPQVEAEIAELEEKRRMLKAVIAGKIKQSRRHKPTERAGKMPVKAIIARFRRTTRKR